MVSHKNLWPRILQELFFSCKCVTEGFFHDRIWITNHSRKETNQSIYKNHRCELSTRDHKISQRVYTEIKNIKKSPIYSFVVTTDTDNMHIFSCLCIGMCIFFEYRLLERVSSWPKKNMYYIV